MKVNRRKLLYGLGASAGVVVGGGAREWHLSQRLDRVRANGRAAGPRREGLTSTSMVWKAETDRRLVALTFDDGPDPRFTPGVLEALAQREAKATFFLQGSHVAEHPDLARQVAEAHVVGNHTYNHKRLGTASVDGAREELERAHEKIAEITGVEARLFRPPYGDLSGAASLEAAHLGYDIILWSQRIDSGDLPGHNVDRLARAVTPGDIVLGHDGGTLPNNTVVDCLPDLLVALDDEGFELVTLPELFEA